MTNPGHREHWSFRPSWHGVVYGNGRPGKGTESDIGPEALLVYPISPRTAETKKPDTTKIATHVMFYGSESITATMNEHGIKELPLSAYATDAPEGRRMTDELRALIHQLREASRAVPKSGSQSLYPCGSKSVCAFPLVLAHPLRNRHVRDPRAYFFGGCSARTSAFRASWCSWLRVEVRHPVSMRALWHGFRPGHAATHARRGEVRS